MLEEEALSTAVCLVASVEVERVEGVPVAGGGVVEVQRGFEAVELLAAFVHTSFFVLVCREHFFISPQKILSGWVEKGRMKGLY